MRPPNIILIVVDDLGSGGLGCYGQRLIQTPHLDRMAQEGMRFEQHYAGSGVCAPSRAVLMTGKHAGHASVRGNTGGIPLPEGEVTLATLLSQAGYACGGFGKWGLGDAGTPGAPERQGFDVFFGYYHQIHAHDYFPEYLWRNGAKVSLTGNEGGGRQVYSHYLIFAEMLRWIRSHKDGPFFCYAPWTLPHGRYEIPADEPALRGYIDRPWSETARIYAGMISLIDRCVGELLALLKELGIDQETYAVGSWSISPPSPCRRCALARGRPCATGGRMPLSCTTWPRMKGKETIFPVSALISWLRRSAFSANATPSRRRSSSPSERRGGSSGSTSDGDDRRGAASVAVCCIVVWCVAACYSALQRPTGPFPQSADLFPVLDARQCAGRLCPV